MQRPTHIKQDLPAHIRLETRTRCNMRVWLSGAERHIDQSAVAFLTVGLGGYAMGLWSPGRGYIYETEERFERGANSEMIITHTRDVLIKFIAPSSLAQLGLDLLSRVVVSAVPSLEKRLFKVLRKAQDLRPVLDQEIEALPSKYRAAFVLCHLQDMTNEQAARELGCPLGTVLSRLSRARELLRVTSLDMVWPIYANRQEAIEALLAD